MPNIPQTSAVPEAPKEVIIRTMASDLELMAKSGGTLVARSQPAPVATPPVQTVKTVKPPMDSAAIIKIVIWGAIGLIGIGIVFVVGYYVVPLVFPKTIPPASTPTLPADNQSAPQTQLPETPELPSPVFSHKSFFSTPAERNTSISLEPATAAANLQTFAERIASALADIPPEISFLELTMQDTDGKPLSWTKFLSFINADLLTSDFFLSKFNQDFTAFIYRDKNGAWPGYVLQLAGNQNPLLFRSQTNAMENGVPALQNLYLVPPGNPNGGFQDSQLVGEPVRTLVFKQAGAVFAYGWFHSKYLVLSTSLNGLKEAVKRL